MSEARLQGTLDPKAGSFCWVELGTSDNEAAKNFYTQLFGWESQDHPMGPDGVYTILLLGGKDVGGLYKLTPDMVSAGVPPHWMSYVATENADETTEKAKAAGGTVMNGPFDVANLGRMSVIRIRLERFFQSGSQRKTREQQSQACPTRLFGMNSELTIRKRPASFIPTCL